MLNFALACRHVQWIWDSFYLCSFPAPQGWNSRDWAAYLYTLKPAWKEGVQKRGVGVSNVYSSVSFCTEGGEKIFHKAVVQLRVHVSTHWACWLGITLEDLSIVMWFLPFPGIFVPQFLARNRTWSALALRWSQLSWHFQPNQKCRKSPKKACFYRLPEGLHMSDMLIQTKPSLPEIHSSLTLMLFSMSIWVVWDFWQ